MFFCVVSVSVSVLAITLAEIKFHLRAPGVGIIDELFHVSQCTRTKVQGDAGGIRKKMRILYAQRMMRRRNESISRSVGTKEAPKNLSVFFDMLGFTGIATVHMSWLHC